MSIYDKQKYERDYDKFQLYLTELIDNPSINLKEFSEHNQYSYSTILKVAAKNNWIERGKAYLEDLREKRRKEMETIFEELNYAQLQLAVDSTKVQEILMQNQLEAITEKKLADSTISRTLKTTEESALNTIHRYYIVTGHKEVPDEEVRDEATTHIDEFKDNNQALSDIHKKRMRGSQKIERPKQE